MPHDAEHEARKAEALIARALEMAATGDPGKPLSEGEAAELRAIADVSPEEVEGDAATEPFDAGGEE